MLSKEDMIIKLKVILSKRRFEHSLRVKETALKLAKVYNCDLEKVEIAAILHDCAKCYNCKQSIKLCKYLNVEIDEITKKRHQLIHAPLGAKIARIKFGVDDEEILNAIYYHTTGRADMSLLEKIIWLADYIEPYRSFDRIEDIRKMANEDINKAMLIAFEESIKYVNSKNIKLHPNTIEARDSILREING